jgi:hypothetical protein
LGICREIAILSDIVGFFTLKIWAVLAFVINDQEIKLLPVKLFKLLGVRDFHPHDISISLTQYAGEKLTF